MTNYNFQYCQKIVVFSNDLNCVLLCRRRGENDYDGVYSFIGGKMETTDRSLIDGLLREKEEEVGKEFKIEIFPNFTMNHLFEKKSGDIMILPYYYARHLKGNIKLSDEYSDFQWVKLENLEKFEPKISDIPEIVTRMLELKKIISSKDLVVI